MKTVILAGGRGSRLSELTNEIPKALVPIGGKPIIEHIIEIYARQGFNDFIVAGGYKCFMLAAWAGRNPVTGANIQVVDTGEHTLTGGRLKLLAPMLEEPFFMTYCDGLANINLSKLLEFHEYFKPLVTVTAVHPPPRFGHLTILNDQVISFDENPANTAWINGGFMVINPRAIRWIKGDVPFEQHTCPVIALRGRLYAYRHDGFWQCMDTLRDVETLNRLWEGGAPWIG